MNTLSVPLGKSDPYIVYHSEVGSVHKLRPFVSIKDLEDNFRALPGRTFPPSGTTFEVHCSNGSYVCTAEILYEEKFDRYTFIRLLSCKLKSKKIKTLRVNFQDDVFPGEEKIISFLTLHLTGSYKIGTVFEIHFSDGKYTCTLGISSCTKKENNVGTLTPNTSETITHILEDEPKNKNH